MAWTYSGDPRTNTKDAVRALIGDTIEAEPLLQDGEINYAISLTGGPITAAIRACELIQAKLSRLADESVGPIRIEYSQKAKGYEVMKNELRRRILLESAAPYAGGISISDKQTQVQNSDRVPPAFTKNQDTNPNSAIASQLQLEEFLWGVI